MRARRIEKDIRAAEKATARERAADEARKGDQKMRARRKKVSTGKGGPVSAPRNGEPDPAAHPVDVLAAAWAEYRQQAEAFIETLVDGMVSYLNGGRTLQRTGPRTFAIGEKPRILRKHICVFPLRANASHERDWGVAASLSMKKDLKCSFGLRVNYPSGPLDLALTFEMQLDRTLLVRETLNTRAQLGAWVISRPDDLLWFYRAVLRV